MTAIDYAKYRVFRERNPNIPAPSFFSGSSVGRYAMLAAAGVLDIEDAVQLSRIRAEATQKVNETVGGAMGQIVGEPGVEDRVRGYVGKVREMSNGRVIVVSNVNTDRHITVSGEEDLVNLILYHPVVLLLHPLKVDCYLFFQYVLLHSLTHLCF